MDGRQGGPQTKGSYLTQKDNHEPKISWQNRRLDTGAATSLWFEECDPPCRWSHRSHTDCLSPNSNYLRWGTSFGQTLSRRAVCKEQPVQCRSLYRLLKRRYPGLVLNGALPNCWYSNCRRRHWANQPMPVSTTGSACLAASFELCGWHILASFLVCRQGEPQPYS